MKSYSMTMEKLSPLMQSAIQDEIAAAIETADLDYADTYRLAEIDDAEAVSEFHYEAQEGCCGSFETTFSVGGNDFLFGCRYGH
jgi:hypothetical protein